jgi:hypothetical protein
LDDGDTFLVLKKLSGSDPVPGSGTVFALRAIGIIFLARWLHSMSQFGIASLLQAMAGSAWACINGLFIFLLVVLPGAKPKAERPYHPLPHWLRKSLQVLGALGCMFALWTIGYFAYLSGLRAVLETLQDSNGWLVVAPALFATVVWLCRARPLWPTNPVMRRFAIGRYTVTLDIDMQTATVWAENRKLGQYALNELSLRASSRLLPPPLKTSLPSLNAALAAAAGDATTEAAAFDARAARYVSLLWNSPAAAGHNRHVVFRAATWGAADKFAAAALDTALRRF